MLVKQVTNQFLLILINAFKVSQQWAMLRNLLQHHIVLIASLTNGLYRSYNRPEKIFSRKTWWDSAKGWGVLWSMTVIIKSLWDERTFWYRNFIKQVIFYLKFIFWLHLGNRSNVVAVEVGLESTVEEKREKVSDRILFERVHKYQVWRKEESSCFN